MRGKVGYIHPFCHGVGITPAYAGKRSAGREFGTAAWDHPRACGEKAMSVTTMNKSQGSPPRMRGKVGHCLSVDSRSGITPAYAGKRPKQAVGSFQPRDHPRVCGEKSSSRHEKSRNQGSPPRMRGKDQSICKNLERMGITPAYAGKSEYTFIFCRVVWDHPRVCGEKLLCNLRPGSQEGSPPRMRGKD